MSHAVLRAFVVFFFFPTSFSLMHAEPPEQAVKKRYICPPCPVACHDVAHDAPGRCPQCSMTLVEQPFPRNVAILVWDGVELLDFAGPGEVFAAATVGGESAFRVYTVGLTEAPITSQGFVKISPEFTIDNCPSPNVLVIPGGGTRPLTENAKLLEWVRETANDTDMVLSVCTGAFVLARAGLLDDLEATTWHGAIENLRRDAPKTKVHEGRRFVENDDIITSAGVSAGIDGALHALSRLTGADVARNTARYMEYDWRPNLPPDERKASLKRRIRQDPGGVIDELGVALREGTLDPAALLPDPAYMKLHENPRFRRIIREYSYSEKMTLASPAEPGDQMIVSGTVRNQKGRPVQRALVYVYHTNNAGVYSSSGGNTGTMGDSLNPRLFGYVVTDRSGRYEYRTIKPGQYPENGPPAHVHYEVSARGHRDKVTELMWEDDSRMTNDGRKGFEDAGFIISKFTKGDDGILRSVCDIKLEEMSQAEP